MAYHQAHLLMLAGYSSFFVSGLVLPQPSHAEDFERIAEEDAAVDMFLDEDESPEDEPIVVDEPCPRFATSADESDCDDMDIDPLSTPIALARPVPEQRRRKRSSAVSESHIRAMSRWLLDSAISLGDRQRQMSDPEPLYEGRETKRRCIANRTSHLPPIRTSFSSCMLPRLSVS